MALCIAFEGRPASAQTTDLTKLSLEDLLNTEITSVSRKEQTLSRTAAAVHVITAEDIGRSGARTIPDLLRMVPGFNVAQIDATTGAVSSRGFNGLYANKLLVLVDGRNVYSQLFGGVHWDMQTMPLADIERIEVVRGPGGSLWGTNAVNGIVNIITKSPDQTQGGLVKATIGGADRGGAELRYGGRIGPTAYYRLYGKYSTRGNSLPVGGFADPDDASLRLGGARIDWLGDVNRLSLTGSVQEGKGRHVREYTLLSAPWATMVNDRTDVTDRTMLLSWTRSASSRADTSVQASYQRFARHRDAKFDTFAELWHLFDMEARQRRAIGRHDLVAGIGYRLSSAAITNGVDLSFEPSDERRHLVTAFLHDEIDLPNDLWLTPGVKLEHNEFTGLEIQPGARVTWSPHVRNSLWAAASRSVRTPSKVDRGLRALASAAPGFGGLPLVLVVEGDPEIDAETVHAFEAGYRVQFGQVFVDATAFRNEYYQLVAPEAGAPIVGMFADRMVRRIPLTFGNRRGGHTHGAEATATWRPVGWWSLTASSALLRFRAHDSASGANPASGVAVPERQLSLRSYVDLPGRINVTTFLSHAALVPASTAAYSNMDVRVAWAMRPPIELAFGVEKLLHDRTVEFVDTTGVQSSPPRTAAFGELSWRF
jgi:iron complex outermembrane receptor protein